MVIYFFVLFCFVFSFKIPVFYNSSNLSVFIMSMWVLFSGSAQMRLLSLMQSRLFLTIFYFYIIFGLYVSLLVVIKGTYDFTFLKSYLNGLFSFVFCAFFVSLFSKRENSRREIYLLFSSLIIVQSLIVILMMFNEPLRVFIQAYTQSDDLQERMATYMGVRGLGLAGSVAFGFAITMALLMLCLSRWLYESNIKFKYIICTAIFFLCAFASLSAGRTAILGILLSVFYIIYLNGWHLNKLYFMIVRLCIYVLMISVLFYFVAPYFEGFGDTLVYYSQYVFQSFYNYYHYGTFSVSSLETLKDMYFYPDGDIWFGDAMYTGNDGEYYLDTDAGYMRFMLYFGFFGSIIFYAFFAWCFYYLLSLFKGNAHDNVLLIIIFFMSFVFHYKGEVVMYNVSFMKVIFIIFLLSLFCHEEKNLERNIC